MPAAEHNPLGQHQIILLGAEAHARVCVCVTNLPRVVTLYQKRVANMRLLILLESEIYQLWTLIHGELRPQVLQCPLLLQQLLLL